MKDHGFRDFVLEQLAALDQVRSRAMFGGHGLYAGEVFFGIVHGERLYFKTDDESRAAYVERGMGVFRLNERQTLKRYYEVPAEVLEDRELLAGWARTAAAVRIGPRHRV